MRIFIEEIEEGQPKTMFWLSQGRSQSSRNRSAGPFHGVPDFLVCARKPKAAELFDKESNGKQEVDLDGRTYVLPP